MQNKRVTGLQIGGPGEGDGGKAERETAWKTMGVKAIWEQPPAQGSPKGWGSCQEADGGTGHSMMDRASQAHGQLPRGQLTLSVLLLGVVGEGRGLHEGHQAVLAREGPVPRVQPQMVLQRGVGRELGPTLLAGEGLLVKVLRQLVVLHPWGGR